MGVAAVLMAGIIAGRYLGVELGGCLGGLGVAAGFVCWRRTRLAGLAIGIFLLGMALYVGRYRVASSDDLRVVLTGEPELVTMRGRLVESPSVREFQAGKSEVAYSYATINVAAIRKGKEEWLPAKGRVATRLRGELADGFFKGRSVEVAGVTAYPAKAAAPGLFDYRAYLNNMRIFFQLKSDSTNDWQLVSFEKMPVTERFQRWAEVQLQRGLPERDEAAEIIAAMTLGQRNTLSGEMADVFMRTGTMHIIAISGLHVACIAYFFYRALRPLGLPRPAIALVIMSVVWFYTFATGLQSTAVRSATMSTVFMMSWILRRPPELTNTVAASAPIILLIQPEQMFQTSFQMSFCVVLVIALAVNLFEKHYPNAKLIFRNKTLRIDPLLPESLIPKWKKRQFKWLGFAAGNFVVAAVSLIASLPLTAFYFNTVTPISLVANMLAVPLSSVSLGATVVSILVPPIAPVSNYIAWIFMHLTIKVVEFFGSFSFGYFYVPKPNGIFFVAYCAAVAVIFFPKLRLGLRKYSCALVIAALSVFWLGSVYAGRPQAMLTVLPCAGNPVLVEEGRELLIDCSSERDADYMLKRFLRGKGHGSLDGLAITHGDAQVVGGFELLRREFRPEVVFTSGVKMRSPGYRKAVGELEKEQNRWRKVATGDLVEGWRVLHPAGVERGFPRADDNAMVLKKRIGAWTVLHLSELGTLGQERLLAAGESLRADVVIAGMPEQGEPLSPALLEAIRPKVIVLGTAEYPYKSQGTSELRKRLEESGATVFYMNETQAVTVSVRANGCLVTSMAGKKISLRRTAEEAE